MARNNRRKLERRLLKSAIKGFETIKKPVLSGLIIGGFGAAMYYKSRLIPKYADDYPYSFIWEGDKNGNLAFGDHKYKRVRTAKDLVKSQISHYRTWDGRSIAESLVQLFLIPDDKKHFDRANTVVLLLQLLLCDLMSGADKKYIKRMTPGRAIMLIAGFYLCAPHLIATCFWLTGSMNYLWMGILQSFFVLPYSQSYHGKLSKMPKSLMFLSGLFAGWSTETGAGAAMMLAGMETVYSLMNKKYSSWMGWGLLGGVLGMLLLLLAPGNRVKYRIENEFSDTLPKTMDEALPGYIPEEYLYTGTMFIKWFKEGFLTTIIRELPLQIPVLMYFGQKDKRDIKTDIYLLGLEAAVFAIPTVMMLSPEYPRRATYPSIIYLLAAALRASDKVELFENLKENSKMSILLGLLVFGFCVRLITSLIADSDFSDQFDRQLRYIKRNKDREKIFVEETSVSPIYTALAGDCSIKWDVRMGVCFANIDDPYNKATAAYYKTGNLYCNDPDDLGHVYEQKDVSSIIFSIVNPLKSFVNKIKQIVFKKERSISCSDTIYYPVKRYSSEIGEFFIYESEGKNTDNYVCCQIASKEELLSLKTRIDKYRYSRIDLLLIVTHDDLADCIGVLGNLSVPLDQIGIRVHTPKGIIGDSYLSALIDEIRNLGYVCIFADGKRLLYTFLRRDPSLPLDL